MKINITFKILITGASRGIGYGIAHRFAAHGASIILLARTASHLDKALSSLPKVPRIEQKHTTIVGDVGDVELWEEKDIDILVNAAGITQHSLLFTTKPEVIADLLHTNLLGTILSCWAVGRNMVRRKSGVIINISSLLGLHKPLPGSAVYAASKAGVVGLTRTLAAELGPAGVRTNCIIPGYIETDMTAKMMMEAARNVAIAGTPLRRFGRVEEVADAAVFLVQCEFINGAEIVVDGGLGCT
ncbi:NAD(P)-binding protein [Wilcoxina mikolae CBS 423.85]|nr:NAD(P)-binding protein [Wilcoxina mikolae CBS 423.85]